MNKITFTVPPVGWILSFLILSACQDVKMPSSPLPENTSSLNKPDVPESNSMVEEIFVTTSFDSMDFGFEYGNVFTTQSLPGPDGLVSLREAIIAANKTPGPQIIGFRIPKSDPGFNGTVFVLKNGYYEGIRREYDALAGNETTINGETQTAFTGNTNPSGPEILLTSDSWGDLTVGLRINSAGNVVNGLIISGFPGAGIVIEGVNAKNNTISSCFIGIAPDGRTAMPNDIGIMIRSFASKNVIGTSSSRNIISGNIGDGIGMGQATENQIQYNYIGLDATGTGAVGNGCSGMSIQAESNGNFIGWNVISANQRNGVEIGNSNQNKFCANMIGSDQSGMGNQYFGIAIIPDNGSSNGNRFNYDRIHNNNYAGIVLDGIVTGSTLNECSVIKNNGPGIHIGPNKASGNYIASCKISENKGNGIEIFGESTNNSILACQFKYNQGLAIDLNGDGETPNDAGDGDSGPNNLMNFPVLESARLFRKMVTRYVYVYRGYYSYYGYFSTPTYYTCTTYQEEVNVLCVQGYIDTPNPQSVDIRMYGGGGNTEGLYQVRATPDNNGRFIYEGETGTDVWGSNTIITATASDANGNTSEFSKPIAIIR
ncbi:right-handed parallel beta-helix repeat-containing protein [candidate division KSB1 bacterium]|nr:right-handed parallel beta-helix repeat-containing protein [candidate division KSB1 bacterium]